MYDFDEHFKRIEEAIAETKRELHEDLQRLAENQNQRIDALADLLTAIAVRHESNGE